MAQYYVPLPAFNPGPGIDFSPVGNALSDLSTQRQRQAQLDQQQRQWAEGNALERQRFGLQQRQVDAGLRNDETTMGWKREDRPSERAYRDAQIAEAQARAKSLGQKNSLDEALAGMISGSFGGSGAPPPVSPGNSSNAPPASGYSPQSYDGGEAPPRFQNALSRDYAPAAAPPAQNMLARRPGVVLASDDSMSYGPQTSPPGFMLAADDSMPLGPRPQQPQPQQPPQSAMARMTPAQRQAFALSLAGKGDAGKVLLDVENTSRLDKAAQNEVDKREINATDGLARINEISASFNPEFLTYQSQIGNWGRALMDKAGKLGPQDQAKLYKYATFRRDAARNINDAIKANSGATVTEQELARNLVELPNSGTGMFDGDSPTEFKAKIDRARETLTLGVARFRYLRQRGFTGAPWDSGVSLDQMRGMINQRAGEILNDLKAKNPGVDPAMLEQEADMRVKKEFAI